MSKTPSHPVKISFRIDIGDTGRIGPGKAALMGAIYETGSIAAAAKVLEMSYPRALKLVDELNALSNPTLILKQHGGVNRGGAELSDIGRRVLALYKSMYEEADKATEDLQNELMTFVSGPFP